ncbi:DUF2158 domain-containing protein [Paraburkholderia youngii]|uniref:DUF2158 domain-containing protein n=1 Tax=Paraburkholderia youngii TaxID=2782701 RepID=UPI003D1B9F42
MKVEELRTQFLGKTVRLKSGGPLMTVESVIETEAGLKLDCCWFGSAVSTTMERAPLHPESVELARAPIDNIPNWRGNRRRPAG